MQRVFGTVEFLNGTFFVTDVNGINHVVIKNLFTVYEVGRVVEVSLGCQINMKGECEVIEVTKYLPVRATTEQELIDAVETHNATIARISDFVNAVDGLLESRKITKDLLSDLDEHIALVGTNFKEIKDALDTYDENSTAKNPELKRLLVKRYCYFGVLHVLKEQRIYIARKINGLLPLDC
jgi:hypothetical protein